MSAAAAVELVVLDLVGTLVRDDGLVERAVEDAIRAVEPAREVRSERVASLRGASKRRMFEELVPAHAERATEEFHRILTSAASSGGFPAVEGATGALEALRDAGMTVYVTTGLDPSVARRLLDRPEWAGLVTGQLTPSGDLRGRPYPDLVLQAALSSRVSRMKRVAVCGDTTNDLLAGARAGAGLLVGVLTGAHDRARLRGTPHDHIIESIAQLPRLLRDPATVMFGR